MTEVHVNRIWFEFIREGKKTIEGRLNKGKFKDMKIGDIISFVNDANKVKVQIINKIKYNSFEEYLLMEGLKRTLPNIKTIKDGLDVYYSYYTKNQEKEHKIVAIEIKIV